MFGGNTAYPIEYKFSVIGMLSRRWSHYICQRNWIADNSR